MSSPIIDETVSKYKSALDNLLVDLLGWVTSSNSKKDNNLKGNTYTCYSMK